MLLSIASCHCIRAVTALFRNPIPLSPLPRYNTCFFLFHWSDIRLSLMECDSGRSTERFANASGHIGQDTVIHVSISGTLSAWGIWRRGGGLRVRFDISTRGRASGEGDRLQWGLSAMVRFQTMLYRLSVIRFRITYLCDWVILPWLRPVNMQKNVPTTESHIVSCQWRLSYSHLRKMNRTRCE